MMQRRARSPFLKPPTQTERAATTGQLCRKHRQCHHRAQLGVVRRLCERAPHSLHCAKLGVSCLGTGRWVLRATATTVLNRLQPWDIVRDEAAHVGVGVSRLCALLATLHWWSFNGRWAGRCAW